MSFIATANPPVQEVDDNIAGDPWYPAIIPADARATCRLDGTVTAARLHHALLAAITSVQAELATWSAAQRQAGAGTLADTDQTESTNGWSTPVYHYRRAVYSALQAELAEAYREIDTTPDGAGRNARVTEQLALKVDEHRRNQRWAISDLLGIPRTTIDLI